MPILPANCPTKNTSPLHWKRCKRAKSENACEQPERGRYNLPHQ